MPKFFWDSEGPHLGQSTLGPTISPRDLESQGTNREGSHWKQRTEDQQKPRGFCCHLLSPQQEGVPRRRQSHSCYRSWVTTETGPTLTPMLVTERSDGGREASPELGALQLAFGRVLLIQLRSSRVWVSAALWTVAHWALLSMRFSRQEYWVGCMSYQTVYLASYKWFQQ